MIDSDTRAAIREFQRDNDLAATGSINRDDEQQLRMSAATRSRERTPEANAAQKPGLPHHAPGNHLNVHNL